MTGIVDAPGARTANVRRQLRDIRALMKAGRQNQAETAASDLANAHPDAAEAWRVLGTLRMDAGDDARAIKALVKGFRLDPDGRAIGDILSLLLQRGRFATAAGFARTFSDRAGESPRLDGVLAKCAMWEGDDDRALTIAGRAADSERPSPLTQRMVKTVESLRSEQAAGDAMAGIRHIAIAGVSHVGSTIFGVILGAIPDFAFAGETHALTEVKLHRTGGRGRIGIRSDIAVDLWPGACRVCGRSCQVFNPEFRLWLAEHPTGKYAHIARRLGTRNLVTSDKNVDLYWERDPLFRFDQIILFKSPEGQMRSTLKNKRKEGEGADEQVLNEASFLLNRWGTTYLEHLYLVRPCGKRIVVNWERLVAEPERHFRKISEILNIPLNVDVLKTARLTHFIGGNTGVDVSKIQKSGSIELRSSNAPPLPKDILAQVQAHKRSRHVHRILEQQYLSMFS